MIKDYFKNFIEQYPESSLYIPFLNSKETFWLWDIDNNDRLIFVSEQVTDILGYKAEDMLNKLFYDFIPNDNRLEFEQILALHRKEKKPFWELITPFIHKLGYIVNLGNTGVPFFDEKSGEVVSFRGMAGF
jgi:PAS domain S-box-containing protein